MPVGVPVGVPLRVGVGETLALGVLLLEKLALGEPEGEPSGRGIARLSQNAEKKTDMFLLGFGSCCKSYILPRLRARERPQCADGSFSLLTARPFPCATCSWPPSTA